MTLPTHCTDCGCLLSDHDAGWCYGNCAPRWTQCNHSPRPTPEPPHPAPYTPSSSPSPARLRGDHHGGTR